MPTLDVDPFDSYIDVWPGFNRYNRPNEKILMEERYVKMKLKKKFLNVISISALLGVAVTTPTFAMLGGAEVADADEAGSARVVPARDNFLTHFPEGGSLPDSWKDKVVGRARTLAAAHAHASIREIYQTAYTAEIRGNLAYVFGYHYSHNRPQFVQLPVEYRSTLYARAMKIMQESKTELGPDTAPLSMAFCERDEASLVFQKLARGWRARQAYKALKAEEEAREAERQHRLAAEAEARAKAEEAARLEAARLKAAEEEAERQRLEAAEAFRQQLVEAGKRFRISKSSGGVYDMQANKLVQSKAFVDSCESRAHAIVAAYLSSLDGK